MQLANYKNKEILLDDGKEYLVIKYLDIDNKKYGFLINKNDDLDGKYVEFIFENNEEFISEITDKKVIESILLKIVNEVEK